MNANKPSLRAFFGNVGMAMARAAGVSAPPEYGRVLLGPRMFSPAAGLPYAVAYAISPDVYACVNLLSRIVAGLELKLVITDGVQSRPVLRKKGNAVDVWRHANPQQTDFEMIEAFMANLLTFGNAYLLKERFRATGGDDTSKPRELWPLASAFMTPVPGPGRTIAEFSYYNTNGERKTYLPQDIAYGRFWSADDQLEGLSPLAVANLRWHTQENQARYLNEMFKHGGGMQGMFSVKTPMSDEQRENFVERLEKRFRDVRKWFMPQFSPTEMEWHPTTSTLRDMMFVEVAKLTTSDIAKGYGVPSDLIGVDKSGALTAASVESSMILLVELTLKPLLKRVERLLDERLWPDFHLADGETEFVECHFDTSKILVVVKSYLDQVKALTEAVGGPFLLRAEAREKAGDPELADVKELKDLVPPKSAAAAGGDDGASADNPTPSGNGDGAKPRSRPRPAARTSRETQREAAELQTERAVRRAEYTWNGVFESQEERVQRAAAATVFPDVVRNAVRVEIPEIEALVALIDDVSERTEVETFLRRLVEASGQSAADTVTTAALAEAIAFDVQALRVAQFLKEHIDRAIRVPNDTTRRMLRLAIVEAWQSGAGSDGVERAIQEVFAVRRGNVGTIARTEVVPALNYSSIEGYKQTGLVKELVWITSQDEVVRGNKPTDDFLHTAMDGVVVPMGDLWRVPRRSGGFETVRYPGDPSGTSGNVINCRCRVVANVARAGGRRDASGVRWWYGMEKRSGHPQNGRVNGEVAHV